MIYIVTHKQFNSPNVENHKVICVGDQKNNLEYLRDDTGINIANKNKNYCELTGLYWIWKNTHDEYKGLVHYRRYFCSTFKKKYISDETVKKFLSSHDMILPFKKKLKTSLVDQYIEDSGYKKDLQKLREVIKRIYPEYLQEYDSVMNGKKSYFCNMMIANCNTFDNYCEWLFRILFELEKEVDLTGYNDYQKRIYGFLSERLLTVYVEHNDLQIKETGVIYTEENSNFLIQFLKACKRKIACYIDF